MPCPLRNLKAISPRTPSYRFRRGKPLPVSPLTEKDIEKAVKNALPAPKPTHEDIEAYGRKLIYDSLDFRLDLKRLWYESNNFPEEAVLLHWRTKQYSRARSFKKRYAEIPGLPITDKEFSRLTATPYVVKNIADVGHVFMSFEGMLGKLQAAMQIPYPDYMVRDSDHTEIDGPGTVDVRRSNHTKIHRPTASTSTDAK
jgi:hypothetical protein